MRESYMALRVEVKPDITGQNMLLVIGNCRKILAPVEFNRLKKIAHSNPVDRAGDAIYAFLKKERMDVVKEANLNEPKRKKLICQAIAKILQDNFKK